MEYRLSSKDKLKQKAEIAFFNKIPPNSRLTRQEIEKGVEKEENIILARCMDKRIKEDLVRVEE